MTLQHDVSHRGWSQGSAHGGACLADKFEILKDIGDGSFGSVALARVRGAGAHIARRGTLVAIKTMKKTFESFAPCLELREIIFLRTLEPHPHLVPALDIFLDPISKKLHIAMESMDGNLYQLMKARNHKLFDAASVKSILYQILSGLEHIHANDFFHRDIKPENILVSLSAREDLGSAFKRYSQLITPPSTPPSYTIKIADFGLAREMHSKLPYTTYVSTRWYRAPEVLLRAGEYSAPVDIWAIGAMAVEVATLKPLFPGGNEVDQVWRVCEIMGSPGNWVNKQGAKVGGGEWKEGVKLAHKLGFAFPKMAPHTMDTILQPPQWPQSLSNFVTSCLMWDPRARPTSLEALAHEYFVDAHDPLRPKSSGSRLLGRKQTEHGSNTMLDANPHHALKTSTSSWFRKSLVARESAPVVPQQAPVVEPISPRLSPVRPEPVEPVGPPKVRPSQTKRNTWTHGQNTGAPMPILPTIRPVSPLSNAVHARASPPAGPNDQGAKKIGRQLSVNSHGNHYADIHRQEAERALNGQSGLMSPPNGQKESFFSHLRKRARRLSGRNQLPISPPDDVEANPGGATGVGSNRNSMIVDPPNDVTSKSQPDFAELDRKLEHVRNSVETGSNGHSSTINPIKRMASNPLMKRTSSLPRGQEAASSQQSSQSTTPSSQSSAWPRRRGTQKTKLPTNQYETPDEQEELLDEVLASTHAAVTHMDREHRSPNPYPSPVSSSRPLPVPVRQSSVPLFPQPYPSPSPTRKRGGLFGISDRSKPIAIAQQPKPQTLISQWPTPPAEENEWAAAVAASILHAGEQWR